MESFKISMVAPSRIGKTSLVTAILSDVQKLLSGTPIIIKSKDAKTNSRINQHRSELNGSLRAGEFGPEEFDSGAMSGTQEAFEFNLLLKNNNDDNNDLTLNFLDFPGGWMSNIQTEDAIGDHAKCAKFIQESSVLIVVVDASIIIEAASSSQKRAIDIILEVPETENIVRNWAKERAKNDNDPALLLICPVKCESYFSDNGGHKDRSDELYRAVVEEVYQQLLPIVNDEANHTEILYMPVDTLGCVEFVSASWGKEKNTPIFSPCFKVRSNPKISVKGADDVLIAIAKQLIRNQKKIKNAYAKELTDKSTDATKKAAEDKTWYQKFATAIFNYETDAEENANYLRGKARDAASEARSIGKFLEDLAKCEFGSRVRDIRQGN